MDIREINNCIDNKIVVYSQKLKKKFIISSVEKDGGKLWAIGKDLEGNDVRVNIRFVENADKERFANEPTPFPEDKKQIMEENEEKTFEALSLLGRKSNYIKKVFSDEMKSAMNKTMMVKFPHLDKPRDATVRTMHYANTCWVALMIARGIFPNDEDLAKGISVCALGHDYGQCAFGHDGEEAARKALENYNAGSISHNVQGALLFQHRLYPDLVAAINEEPIIEEEIIDEEVPLGDVPQSGDTENVLGFIGMMLAAVAGLVTTRKRFN